MGMAISAVHVFGQCILHDAAPQFAPQLLFSPVGNVQINPLAIRADFKFLIFPRVARFRLQEDFRDIALPQFVAPPIFPRVLENCNVSIVRQKAHIQSVRRPEQSHFGRPRRVGVFTFPVVLKALRRALHPGTAARKSFSIRLARKSRGKCHG